jgi:hypothetical protein
LASATPASSPAQYMPGSIKPMSATGPTTPGSVVTTGFESKPGENTSTASTAYGASQPGMVCNGDVCYPAGSVTTAAPAGFAQPAFGTSPAPATNAGGSIYR